MSIPEGTSDRARRVWRYLAQGVAYALDSAEVIATVVPHGDVADVSLAATFQVRPRGPLSILRWLDMRAPADQSSFQVETETSPAIAHSTERQGSVWTARFERPIASQFRVRLTSRHTDAFQRGVPCPELPELPEGLRPPRECFGHYCAVPTERIALEVRLAGWPGVLTRTVCWTGERAFHLTNPAHRCEAFAAQQDGEVIRLSVDWPALGHTFALVWEPEAR